jgi:hypothetical protein
MVPSPEAEAWIANLRPRLPSDRDFWQYRKSKGTRGPR